MASKHLEPEQQNFVRLAFASVDEVQGLFRHILRIQISPKDLFKKIHSNTALTTGNQKLNSEQQKLCYIPGPVAPNYDHFDVTLLYKLIRNLCPTLQPSNGWGKKPHQTDINIGDDIERLRLFRNEKLGHAESSRSIPDNVFNSSWNELENIFKRCQGFLTSNGSPEYKDGLASIKITYFGLLDYERTALYSMVERTKVSNAPKISLQGDNLKICGESACFVARFGDEENSYSWPITWQRLTGSTTQQIDTSIEKYQGSSSHQLVIARVSKEDQGEYRAMVSREENGTHMLIPSNTLYLTVTGDLPNLKIENAISEEDRVTIHYSITVNDQSPPVDSVVWTKNGKHLETNSDKYTGGQLLDTYLTIHSPTSSDIGQYKCEVSNAVGPVMKSIYLSVPAVSIVKDVEVIVGNPFTTEATIDSCPTLLSAEWQKDNGPEFENIEIVNMSDSKYFGSKNDPEDPRLVIPAVTHECEKYYRLVVVNGIGRSTSNTLCLKLIGDVPSLSVHHETNISEKSVLLVCKMTVPTDSLDVSNVYWTKDDLKIDIQRSGGKYSGGSIAEPSLSIKAVNPDDKGIYRCYAANSVGEMWSEKIPLGLPTIEFDNPHFDGLQKRITYNATIRSIPVALKAEWKVKEDPNGDFKAIVMHDPLYKGSTAALPCPRLVINEYKSEELVTFQLEVFNFIGSNKRSTRDIVVGSSDKSQEVSDSLKKFYSRKGSNVRFANLSDDLAESLPESKLERLKHILVGLKEEDKDYVESVQALKSVREMFILLQKEKLFTQTDVIHMQYLLKKVGCEDLNDKCIQYARKQRALCFFEKSPDNGFKHVKFHVTGPFEMYSREDIQNIRETIVAILDCRIDDVEIDGICPACSFFVVLAIKERFVGKIFHLDQQQIDKLYDMKVDNFILDGKKYNIEKVQRDSCPDMIEDVMESLPYDSTPKTTDTNRISCVFLGPCTDGLCDVLRHYVPPSTFSHVIKVNKKNLPCLTADQRDLILPRHGSYTGNYSDMDISLLYILLRTISGIPPHSNGWGNDPDPSDRSLSANIERVRLIRNKCYGHSISASMSNTNFLSIWSAIRSVIVDLDAFLHNGNKYQMAVDFLRYESMDPELDQHYETELRKQVEEDRMTRKMVVSLKRKFEEKFEEETKTLLGKVAKLTESRIPPNVRDLYNINIQKWREEDKLYYETHSFPSVMEKVRNQPCLTFVGVPGSGKSATAHHIALKLQEEGYEVVPINDVRKMEDYGDPRNPQVFVIDDVVGVFGLQKTKLDVLADYEQKITKPCMIKSRTLMTCRETVFNEALPYKSFLPKEETVIRLHSSDHALDDNDKKEILKKYGLNVDLLSPALLTLTYPMFPRLCKLFSKETKFRALGSRFFLNPVQCIINELDNMQRHNKLHYAALVLCMLNESSLSKDILKDRKNEHFLNMKFDTLENCELESQTDAFKFVKALSAMEGTYTKQSGAHYTFIHDSMFEICAYHYGKQFPEQMLLYMSSSYIVNYVKPQKSEPGVTKEKHIASISVERGEGSDDSVDSREKEKNVDKSSEREESSELCIRLREYQYPLLAERLYRDIQNMELYDVFRSLVLKHPQVCQAFINVLETKSYPELKSLFLSNHGEVEKIVSKREDVEMEGEDWRDEQERRRVLFDQRAKNDNGVWGENTYNARVISWVIYYGHYQMLEYIIHQAEQHSEASKLFDITGNFPHQSESWIYTCNKQESEVNRLVEQCRLLLLSCYSGDVQTVRVLLPVCKKAIKWLGQLSRDIYWCDSTPLTAACEGGHVSMVGELIKAGADVNLQNRWGNTPLRAAVRGSLSTVKCLVENGADLVTQVDDMDESTVYRALVLNKPDIMKYLIQEQNKINPGKFTGNAHLCNCLVDIRHAGVKTDSRDDVVVTGRSVWCINVEGDLWRTIRWGDCDEMRHLLCVGLDVNQSIQVHGKNVGMYDVSPLLHTLIDDRWCGAFRAEKVRIVLEAGADVNVRVRYREYDSVLDREGVSVLERMRQQLCKYSESEDRMKEDEKKYKEVICEIKKHVRRNSV